MNHSVVGLESAEQELAGLWLDARNRGAITDAAGVIDQLLGTNPESEGESRPAGHRILFVAPLAVVFRILPDDRLVIVMRVWQIAKRR